MNRRSSRLVLAVVVVLIVAVAAWLGGGYLWSWFLALHGKH